MLKASGEEYLTVKEVAKVAGVSLSTAYYWLRTHLVTYSPIELGLDEMTSVRRLVSKTELDAFLRMREER